MDDIKWFIGFLVIMGAMWVFGANKSPERGTRTATTTPQTRTLSSPSKSTVKQNVSEKRTAGETMQGLPRGYIISETILPQPLDPNMSFLRGRLQIVSVRKNTRPSQEYVVLQASPKNKYDVAITGLTLKSKVTFLGEEIPKAWKLPFPANEGSGEIVTLRPGEKAYIISGHSPNGQSFQLNKCTGYFEQGMNFVPSLPLRCPRPVDDPLPLPPNTLSDACYDYLKTLGRCKVPPSSVPTKLRADGSCQAHIFSKISYNQCVTYYKNDRGFFQGEWRIYLGRNTRLWKDKREIIELLDENGRTIDRKSF